MVKIAAVQFPPIYYDLERCSARAVEIIKDAANEGIQCVVFPEAWLSGYPMLAWEIPPENEFGPFSSIYKRMFESSPNLKKDELRPIKSAAKEFGVVVVLGFTEQASEMSAGTLYNSVAIIDADGRLLNTHRKTMPTNPERMVWGFGDGSGLKVAETAVGRVGALLCWENLMPLARTAIYAQNVEIYCAPTADTGDNWLASMKHIGREGSCFVVAVASAMTGEDIPADLPPHRPDEAVEGWIVPGDGIICGPLGDTIAGPMREEKGFLVADIDLAQVREARRIFDVVGHYSRPDIYKLTVNCEKSVPVELGNTDG